MKSKLIYKESTVPVRVGDTISHAEGPAKVIEITANRKVLIRFDSAKVRPNYRELEPEEIGAEFAIEQALAPPLGLRPRYIWIAHRVDEIREAIQRYQDAGVSVPRAWNAELNALLGSALTPVVRSQLDLKDFDESVQYQPAYSREQLRQMCESILPFLVGLGPMDVEVEKNLLLNRAQNSEIVLEASHYDEGLLFLIAFMLNNAKYILNGEQE